MTASQPIHIDAGAMSDAARQVRAAQAALAERGRTTRIAVGHGRLDAALARFQGRWDSGLTGLGEEAGRHAEGLDGTVRLFEETDAELSAVAGKITSQLLGIANGPYPVVIP